MKIKNSLTLTVGLTVLICLGGCGRSDAPVVLEPLEISETTGDTGESGKTAQDQSEDAKNPVYADEAVQAEVLPATVLVHVCGQVRNPGVYELPSDARIADALLAAGDFTVDADIDYWNQAAIVTDGQQIYVPSEAETAAGYVQEGTGAGTVQERRVTAETASGTGAGRLNINTATLQQLKELPGIGDVKAGAIVAYRESKGAFASVEEIRQVDGIKDGVYEKIKDLICVN